MLSNCLQPEEDHFQVEDHPIPHFHTFLYVSHGLDGARDGCMESSGEGCSELCRHSVAYVDWIGNIHVGFRGNDSTLWFARDKRRYRNVFWLIDWLIDRCVATDFSFWIAQARFDVCRQHPSSFAFFPFPCDVVRCLWYLLQLGLRFPSLGNRDRCVPWCLKGRRWREKNLSIPQPSLEKGSDGSELMPPQLPSWCRHTKAPDTSSDLASGGSRLRISRSKYLSQEWPWTWPLTHNLTQNHKIDLENRRKTCIAHACKVNIIGNYISTAIHGNHLIFMQQCTQPGNLSNPCHTTLSDPMNSVRNYSDVGHGRYQGPGVGTLLHSLSTVWVLMFHHPLSDSSWKNPELQ